MDYAKMEYNKTLKRKESERKINVHGTDDFLTNTLFSPCVEKYQNRNTATLWKQ